VVKALLDDAQQQIRAMQQQMDNQQQQNDASSSQQDTTIGPCSNNLHGAEQQFIAQQRHLAQSSCT